MVTIKVLGPGCARCQKLAAITRQIASEMGVQVEIVKVTEYPDIMAYNIMSTPGLVINEKLVSSGRLPAPGEIRSFIANALT